MSAKIEGVYVDLDALLDTRIGTVAKHFGDDTAIAVLSSNYHTREDDKFPGLGGKDFKALYQARDTETIQNSSVTNLVFRIREMIGELTKQAIIRPYHSGSRLVVNTFPYKLTEEESAALVDSVTTLIGDFSQVDVAFKVEVINISKTDLTPSYCLDNFLAMFMYEYDDWFAAQQHAFIQTPTPALTLYAPAIYFEQTPTSEEIEEAIRDFSHPLRAVEIAARPFINLELIGVDHYSIIHPIDDIKTPPPTASEEAVGDGVNSEE